MKVFLVKGYWKKLVTLPTTVGAGTVIVWLRRSTWPRRVDQTGLVLRNHQRVAWGSVRKIGVARRYADDRITYLRIHHGRGVSHVPIDALENGENVAREILTMFAGLRKERSNEYRPVSSRRFVPSLADEQIRGPVDRAPMHAGGHTKHAHFA
jgi:hypothetical protein